MKMDASYACSWHIWNMKFCCILGRCSCIQQLITSRSWSSSLFTTLFSASEMHQGHHSGGLLCCEKGSIFIMQLQQLGCLKAALSTLLQSHIGEFGFLRLQKTKQNNPTQQQPKKPPQNKKTPTPMFWCTHFCHAKNVSGCLRRPKLVLENGERWKNVLNSPMLTFWVCPTWPWGVYRMCCLKGFGF